MNNAILSVVLAALAAPAAAQSWAQRAAGVAGGRLLGVEVPGVGEAAAVPAAAKPGFKPSAGFDAKAFADGGLYAQAKAFAGEIARVDKSLDARYGTWRKSLSEADRAAVDGLLKERAYYAGVWASIVEPARDFAKADPRVTPVLQALHLYLSPMAGRVERLETGKAAAAKSLAKARDAWNASAARLHLDDRKSVEELGLTEGDWAKVEAAVAEDRKASAEYMGWVREAYDRSTDWAKAMRVYNAWAEQHDWVLKDYAKNAELAKALTDKKLGK